LCSRARLFLCLARTLPYSFLPVLSHPLSPYPARFIFLSTSLDLPLLGRSLSFNVFVAPVRILSIFHHSFTLSYVYCILEVSYCISEPSNPPPHPFFFSFLQPTFSLSPSPNPAVINMVLPFHFRSYYPALFLLLLALRLPLSPTFSLPLHLSSTFPVSHPAHWNHRLSLALFRSLFLFLLVSFSLAFRVNK